MASNASGSSSGKMKLVADQNEMTPIVGSFPDDVMENIISFFPIKKAVGSGLISKRFLNSWRYSRDLSFDIDFRRLADRADILNIIKRVMDQHSGPVIERLRVILDPSEKENLVLDWIRKAIAKGAEELDLNFSPGLLPFVLPSDILDAARLQVLKVSYCDLESLKQLDGLRYLKTITFDDLRLPRAFSEAIFANCLLLENFEISRCYSEFHLVIQASQLKNFKSLKVVHFDNLLDMYVDAPSLQVFHYIGDICHIILKREMFNMMEAVLHFNPSRSINLFPGVENLMIALRFTKSFSISSSIVERLCARFVDLDYREFQFCLWNLREISLCLGGSTGTFIQSTYLNPYDIACFLNKSPYVEKLTIDFGVFPLESGPYWEFQAKYKFAACIAYFKFLNTVRFTNFKFLALEMQLAKFILTNAKDLEHCIIVKAKHYRGGKEDEAGFVRWLAAEKPQTIIYEHNENKHASS